jgi:hypothetical protein
MAQELTDKIRAAAQAKGIDPDIALAIAKAESSLRPSATPGTSSAGGLFQVVDKTWKEFGGKPGKKFDPDENIRVGTDIIAKNTQTLKSFLQRDPRPAEIYAAHYFGANGAKSFLTAEPNTPMESLFPAKVIKANPNLKGKTSGQVLASLETKMGSAPAVSRETPAPVTREPLPPSLPPMAAAPAAATVAAAPTGSKMASLGPSYQAALALSFLADTDDKEDRDIDREPGVAEKWLAQMDAAPRPAALAEFADVKIRSPFAEPQQPIKMAGGGQVELPIYDVKGNRTIIGDGGSSDAYSDPNPSWSAKTPTERAEYYQDPKNALMAGITQLGQKGFSLTSLGMAQNFFNPTIQPAEAQIALGITPQQTFRGSELEKQDAVNEAYATQSLQSGSPLGAGLGTGDGGMGSGGGRSAGDSTGTTSSTSSDTGVGNPGESYFRGGIVRRSEGSPEAGERALTPEEIAAASKPAFLTPKSGKGRQISTKPGELEGAALQGVSEMPYNLVGAPVDLATMVMRPFGYSVEKPFLGSEDLKERALKAGIRQKPPEGKAARALYELTQAGSGLLNPAAPVRGAVKAAEATGEAAKMLARDFQKYNQQLSVPGASYAVRNKGTPFMMGYGRTEGPDGKFPAMDQAEKYIKLDVATTKDPELNDWLSKKLTSYLRRDFATPDDQFVKAADANQLLHFVNKPIPKRPDLDPYDERISDFSSIDSLPYVRKTQGFKAEGEAKTEYGKRAETLTDASAWPLQLDDITSPGLIPPGMRDMVKTDPTARLTELGVNVDEMLQFDKLAGDMERMRSMPKVYSAYSQPGIKVPEEYLLTDEMLIGLTPAQASNRVAKFRNWEEENRQRMASKAFFEDPAIDRTPAGNGSVWINPTDLEERPGLLKLVQDVGCDGGWCTREEATALSYGSGENRLSILMDSKARPQAQLTITSREYGADDFVQSMEQGEYDAFRAAYPNIAAYNTEAIARTPEFQQWRTMNPDSFSITEIKGVNNQAYLRDAPYLKQIQQQIKDLDSRFNLQSVENLDGIGMSTIPKNQGLFNPTISLAIRLPLEKTFGSEAAGLAAVRNEAIRLNNGSQYTINNEDDIADLLNRALGNVLTPPQQRATGGMIERQSTDNRRYL